jgi:hypothetical protein
MEERKVVPFDEFYYQLKLMHLFLLHPVYLCLEEFAEKVINKKNVYFDESYYRWVNLLRGLPGLKELLRLINYYS